MTSEREAEGRIHRSTICTRRLGELVEEVNKLAGKVTLLVAAFYGFIHFIGK